MKTKLIGIMALLAGSTLFAAPRVVVGLGIGVPAYGYAAPVPPPPVYAAPYANPYVAAGPAVAAPAPVYGGGAWVNGYWGFVGGARVWHPGYWRGGPAFRGRFRSGWRR